MELRGNDIRMIMAHNYLRCHLKKVGIWDTNLCREKFTHRTYLAIFTAVFVRKHEQWVRNTIFCFDRGRVFRLLSFIFNTNQRTGTSKVYDKFEAPGDRVNVYRKTLHRRTDGQMYVPWRASDVSFRML